MVKPLQVDAKHLGEFHDARKFDSIPQFFAALTAVHIVALQLISSEEGLQAIVEHDDWSPEPTVKPRKHPGNPALTSVNVRTGCFGG